LTRTGDWRHAAAGDQLHAYKGKPSRRRYPQRPRMGANTPTRKSALAAVEAIRVRSGALAAIQLGNGSHVVIIEGEVEDVRVLLDPGRRD